MIQKVLDELALHLDALGVRSASARRVLAEARDHLEEVARHGDDPAARFGDPQEVARLVAAEIATSDTRRSTFSTFGVLALTGLVYLWTFALVPAAGGWQHVSGGRVHPLGPVLAVALVLLPQIAFVAGCLALLKAFRLRSTDVVPDAALRLVRRRSVIALAAGIGTCTALALLAVDSTGDLASWWTWSTLALSAILAFPLVGALATVLRAARTVSPATGSAGDVFDDFAPLFRLPFARTLAFPEHPWRFALCGAVAVGLLALAGGWYAEGDLGSGLVRGVFEATALLVCFAALGRTLGLRRTTS